MKTKGISGGILKWMAIIIMLIDHIGASVIEVNILNIYGSSPVGSALAATPEQYNMWLSIDFVLRMIGRVAFPIFCFLIVEGFLHTGSVKKYALRLGAFAIISDIPFDLALHNTPFYWQYQNVFFTLLLGLLAIWIIDYFKDKMWAEMSGVAAACGLAYLLKTDYGVFGVVFIIMLYIFRGRIAWRNITGSLSLIVFSVSEITAPLAFIPITLYNGTRGKQPRYFFYLFYPVHLLLLYLFAQLILPLLV